MSLILEALKKSEAKRQLGQMPTLGSSSGGRYRRRGIEPSWIILPLLFAAVGGGLWWVISDKPENAKSIAQSRQASSEQGAAQTPGGATDDAAERAGNASMTGADGKDAPTSSDEIAASQAASHRPKAAAQTGVEPDPTVGLPVDLARAVKSGDLVVPNPQMLRPQPHQPEPQPDPMQTDAAAPAPTDIAVTTIPASTPMPTAEAQPMAPAVAPSAAASTTTSAPVAAPAPGDPVAGAPPSPPPAAQAVPAAPTSAPGDPPPTPVTQPAAPDLPRNYELPYALRRELPPLKLSMHVYNASPELRFIILDGNRQMEGSPIGKELDLIEIRPDGVVLEFRQQRFFLPRRGS